MTAPAAMPSVEDSDRYRKAVDDVNRMRDDGTLPRDPRAIPTGIASPLNACCYREQCRQMRALLIRAKDYIVYNADSLSMNSPATLLVEEIAAAIRAQGE